MSNTRFKRGDIVRRTSHGLSGYFLVERDDGHGVDGWIINDDGTQGRRIEGGRPSRYELVASSTHGLVFGDQFITHNHNRSTPRPVRSVGISESEPGKVAVGTTVLQAPSATRPYVPAESAPRTICTSRTPFGDVVTTSTTRVVEETSVPVRRGEVWEFQYCTSASGDRNTRVVKIEDYDFDKNSPHSPYVAGTDLARSAWRRFLLDHISDAKLLSDALVLAEDEDA